MKAKCKMLAMVAGAGMLACDMVYGTPPREKVLTGRDFFNAPINFSYPYLGDVGHCYLQTHSNGWTQANIDGWVCRPASHFSNGVAEVEVRNGVDRWTILRPDEPLYRFGRYWCGMMREDRANGGHAICVALFFDGELIGAEYLRAGFSSEDWTWKEYDNVPDGIRQIGGGDWEVGVLIVPDPLFPTNSVHPKKVYEVDIDQMILRHGESFKLSRSQREFARRASLRDLNEVYAEVERIIKDLSDGIPGLTTYDDRLRNNCAVGIQGQFLQMLIHWRCLHARTEAMKQRVFAQLRAVDRISGEAVEMNTMRGSRVGADFGEDLREEYLLKAWLLDGEDAANWERVCDMRGKIGKYELRFEAGVARSEAEEREEGRLMFKVFKIQFDFYREGGFTYAKVIGDDADFCYMPIDYVIPAWIVKVDARGNIVKTYPYPKNVNSLVEFFKGSTTQATAQRSPRRR